jgi:choline monooxygenase
MTTSFAAPQSKSPFSPDPEHSGTLPAYYYYDTEIYEQEKKSIWFRNWQYVGLLENLKEPGDYITGKIIDQEIFVIRGTDRMLHAYYNVCMHRGHILLEGKGNKRMYTCSFHGWMYDTEGKLRHAANSENVTGFSCEDFSLTAIKVEEFANMAFVNLDPQAPSLNTIAGSLAEEFKAAIPNFDKLTMVREDKFELKANWKFILDGMECYHCPYIHPQVMGNEKAPFEDSFESTEHEYHATHIVRSKKEMLTKEKFLYDPGATDVKDVYIWYLWPNYIFIAHVGQSNFKIAQAVPNGPEVSFRIVTSLCLNNPPSEQDRAQMETYLNVAWPQDRDAMEKQARGIRSRGYTQGRLMVDKERSSKSEHATHHFQNLVWLALNGPRY